MSGEIDPAIFASFSLTPWHITLERKRVFGWLNNSINTPASQQNAPLIGDRSQGHCIHMHNISPISSLMNNKQYNYLLSQNCVRYPTHRIPVRFSRREFVLYNSPRSILFSTQSRME